MNPHSSTKLQSWRTAAILIALAVFLAWLQFIQWPMPVTGGIDHRDSGVFAYGGWVIASGGAPYVDFWDQKPPMVFLLNAVAIKLSRMKLVGAWWLSLIALLSTLPLAWWVLRRWTALRPALIATALYAVSFTGVLQAGNSVELFALPARWLLWGAALSFAAASGERPERRRWLLAVAVGFLAGVLFSLRQNEIATAIALGAVLTWQILIEKRRADLVRLYGGALLGFLLLWVPLLAYLGWNHALAAFWDETFRYNFQHKIVNTAAQRLDAFGAAFDFLPLYGVALLAWGILLAAKLRNREERWTIRERLLAVAFPLETMMVLLSGQRFPHYFISLLPIGALSAAYLIERAEIGWGRNPGRTRTLVWSLAGLLALVTLVKAPHRLAGPLYSMRGRVEREAAERLCSIAQPGDILLVWGMAPEIYVYTKLKPAGKYTHVYPLLSPGYTDVAVVREFLEELRARPPALILDASSHNGRVPSLRNWPDDFRHFGYPLHPELKRFYTFFEENYEKTASLENWEWTIYRRVVAPPQSREDNGP